MIEEIESKKNAVIVSAMQADCDTPTSLEKVRVLMRTTRGNDIKYLPGHNLFLRRDSFCQLKGFPEQLRTCEDVYFTNAAAQIGKLIISSKVQYIHLGEDKKCGEFFKKEIWRGSTNLKSLFGRKIPISEYPSIVVPIWLSLCFGIFFISLFLCKPFVALIMVLLYAIPILLYSLRLWLKNVDKSNFFDVFRVYLCYHTARAIGLIKGVFNWRR